MISNAPSSLTNAIRRMLQGSCRQRCRVHFARNLHETVLKAHQKVVAVALRSVLAQQCKEAVLEQWGQVSVMFAAKHPMVA